MCLALATHDKGRQSESFSFACLSACLPRLHPPSSAAVHPPPLAACVFLPQQINHSSPGGRALCSSARCCRLLCSAWERCVTSYVHMTLFWRCSEWLLVWTLCGEPHHSTFHSLHELFSRQWPQRLTHASKQDAGLLCHQLINRALLPGCLEGAVIRDIVFGGTGAFQSWGESNCLQQQKCQLFIGEWRW